MKRRLIFLVFVILLVGIGQLSWAGTRGKIAGKVVDAQSKEPLPGVNVIIEGTTMGAATNLKGEYFILNVPPGVYTLKAQMIGYVPVRKEGVRVNIDQTSTINFQLSSTVLHVAHAVTVVAERPPIQKDMTYSMAAVGADQIKSLPAQELSDVLQIQAGLVKDSFGGLHIRGGRSGEVAYWIDGVAATDVFSGDLGIQVDNSSIKEMQVISGTFNAEYGQAMSGIVNIVTKEGSDHYQGQVKSYLGDYVTKHTQTFNHLDDINPLSIHNLQASASGPVPFTRKKLLFFAMGRHFYDDGWLYGRRDYLPQGLPGDSSWVPMNFDKRSLIQAKLTYKITPSFKLNYQIFFNTHNFKNYNQYFKYNPEGDYKRFENSLTHQFALDHVLSPSTYYNFRVTKFFHEYKHYVYENPLDTPDYVRDPKDSTVYHINPKNPHGYVHTDSLNSPVSYSLARAGMEMDHFKRSTAYWVAKYDITSQINSRHELKSGFEFRRYELKYDWFRIQPKRVGNEEVRPFEPAVPSPTTPYHDVYTHHPYEFSMYVQDKIELKSLIMNIGIRYDMFYADAKILADPSDPDIYFPAKAQHRYKNYAAGVPDSALVPYTLAERERFWYKNVKRKMQISPRLAIAYPITDRGVIHFSYGHFFQMPLFEYLYANPGYKVTQSSGSTIVGNPDLDAQRTVQYEIGLQQEIVKNVTVDATLFYRDVRDWVGTSPPIEVAIPGVWYSKYENKDYSNVRGITISLQKRYSNHFSASLDYSYMVAEGTYSNPNDAFNELQAKKAPRLQMIPLDWDQRHTLNANIGVGDKTWWVSLLGRFYTGLPYTPSFRKGTLVGASAFSGLRDNSARKPDILTFDLYLNRNFKVNRQTISLFANIYNLFDRENATNVYSDTGKPDYTPEMLYISKSPERVGSIKEVFTHPDWYRHPRKIQVGVAVNF